jgi:hypothetical protein
VTVGLGSAAVAQAQKQPGQQGIFRLAATNTANAVSSLVGSVAQDAMLLVDNNRGGPALDLQVEPGQAPMKVDSGAKVANLNADRLDGKSEEDFYAADSQVSDSDSLDGKDSTEFLGSNEKAADADKLDNVDSTEFVPKYVSGSHYSVFRDTNESPVVCMTESYTPSRPKTVLLNSWVSARPLEKSDLSWGIRLKNVFSTDGGQTWREYGDFTADVGSDKIVYAHVSQTDVIPLEPGKSYIFGARMSRDFGTSDFIYECEIHGQITLR